MTRRLGLDYGSASRPEPAPSGPLAASRLPARGRLLDHRYGGSECHLRDTKGLGYLAVLLRQPEANVRCSRWPSRDARTRSRRPAACPTTSGCTLRTQARSPARREPPSATGQRRRRSAPARTSPVRSGRPSIASARSVRSWRATSTARSGPGRLHLHARSGHAHPLDPLNAHAPAERVARRGRRCVQSAAIRS